MSVVRRIKLSKFRLPKAEVSDVYYQQRGIDRNTLQELATCQQQVRTRYIRLPDLLVEHDEAVMAVHSSQKLLKRYSSYKLLIIDE